MGVAPGPAAVAYLPLLVLGIFLALMAWGMVSLGRRLGPRAMSPAKGRPFESGVPGVVPHRGPVAVRYYRVALLFVVFDVEVVFLYLWGVLFRRLGLFGFVEMGIFLGVLALALVHAWRKGALQWD